MTFKDEMRAAGAKPDGAGPGAGGPGSGPESEDIAQLLRALNEDLHAEEDEDLEAETVDRQGIGLPLGKIAAALFAAVGVGAVAIMLNTANDPGPVQTASVPVAQQAAQTQAPPAQQPTQMPATTAAPQTMAQTAAQTAAQTPPAAVRQPGSPEPLIARAPAAGAQPPAQAPAPPPAGAAPAAPAPALKVPEPPSLPPLAAQPRAAAPQSAGTHTVPKAPEAPPPAAEPPHAAAQKPDTAELQAMLAPPKEAARAAARPAAPTEPRTAQPAPRATTPTPPAASGPVPAGRYTVQLGTFQQAANADALVTKLKAQGFQAYAVSWTDGAQRSWRAVRVGGYGDQSAAKQAAGEVKAKTGLDSIVVSTTR
ncbi:SPOR domain-containing protein [Azospirillum thermophilum]|uniref:SPOR domain-containing protein n=1 Tax=Azospirillum thermophilum TaxID=2202148 RepID=UPI001FEA0167|nr:SPOR domain-containing protein [Azospirillum thermophilum]